MVVGQCRQRGSTLVLLSGSIQAGTSQAGRGMQWDSKPTGTAGAIQSSGLQSLCSAVS